MRGLCEREREGCANVSELVSHKTLGQTSENKKTYGGEGFFGCGNRASGLPGLLSCFENFSLGVMKDPDPTTVRRGNLKCMRRRYSVCVCVCVCVCMCGWVGGRVNIEVTNQSIAVVLVR